MNLKTGILVMGMAVATAWGQNPDAIDNARSTMNALHQKQQMDSNAALAGSAQTTSQTSGRDTSRLAKGASAKAGKPSAKTIAVTSKDGASKPNAAVDNSKTADASSNKSKSVVLTGQRDPFVSPVVNQAMTGSGCSVGKRCLAIDQIALKGIVRSDNGMIAVVVNALDKAYFLRENDPVFNGYVVKITGDSVIFKENVQDRLGKPFTREVTKKITTPAV